MASAIRRIPFTIDLDSDICLFFFLEASSSQSSIYSFTLLPHRLSPAFLLLLCPFISFSIILNFLFFMLRSVPLSAVLAIKTRLGEKSKREASGVIVNEEGTGAYDTTGQGIGAQERKHGAIDFSAVSLLFLSLSITIVRPKG